MRIEWVRHRYFLLSFGLSLILLFSVGLRFNASANTQNSLDTAGYLDFSYGSTVVSSPSGDKSESKLWWNDGLWWASLWNPEANAYRIYQLNWGPQTWLDSGVQVDDRPESKADVLWDESKEKLYIVSHIYHPNASSVKEDVNKGRLYRFSYDKSKQDYELDPGFPTLVNNDKTETLVLAKDSTGRLWVTYVSRDPAVDPNDYMVYANVSGDDGLTWGTPYPVPVSGIHVFEDDISSIVAFRDNGGSKIGIMWSNQLSMSLNFATHVDSVADPQAGWNLKSVGIGAYSIDDHINLKSLNSNSSGQVFGVLKTGATQPTDPLIILVARDMDGSFSLHAYSTKADDDTRPVMLIDEADQTDPNDDKVYVFVSGREFGSEICYKTLAIKSPLSAMGDFPDGDCGIPFIKDSTYKNIDNATTTKQNVNKTTGLVVLASDDINGKVYLHNSVGNLLTYLPLLMKNP
jgi:hypothetical protein